MPKVIDIIHRLLPEGTHAHHRDKWSQCPAWPPDLFAATATLVKLSECYSHLRYSAPRYTRGRKESWFYDDTYLNEITRLGGSWRNTGEQPDGVQAQWDALLSKGSEEVSPSELGRHGWWDAAIKLMAIADVASAGIGFGLPPGEEPLPIADLLVVEHRVWLDGGELLLPQIPSSLCIMVPKEEACVQPKAMTVQVGYTLRSLTHNLALLPPIGEVTTRWLFGASDDLTYKPLNLLLIPFPYRIDGGCFKGERRQSPANFFAVRQNWLPRGNADSVARKLSDFFISLVNYAEREAGAVHGIVLPEAALEKNLAQKIARILASKTNIEFFISGILTSDTLDDRFPKNQAYVSLFSKHAVHTDWHQSKHHRWKLDREQIRRYHLGHVLDPEETWWEKVDITDRTCTFSEFRYGAIMATLVCEDLARIEPVQAVLRAVGPNLVVALLMDGPQLSGRWPGRYATVLADDPGSAVLTLTSLGMIRRSVMPGDEEPREVALWKDSTGIMKELRLPQGSHALLLTISCAEEENWTVDGRSDEGVTTRLALSGAHGIACPNPPKWLD